MRLDARNEFCRAERLHDVVVRAVAEAADLVAVLLLRRHEEDRHVLFFAHGLADREAVDERQHDVEHEQVKIFRKRPVAPCAPVARRLDRKACRLEVIRLELADGAVVFHDENAFHESRPFSWHVHACGASSASETGHAVTMVKPPPGVASA